MNQSQLNSTALGNGTPDHRYFVVLTVAASAVSVVTAYARRYVSSSTASSATISANFKGIFRVALNVTSRATTVISTGTYYAKYVTSAIVASAVLVSAFFARRFGSASLLAAASGVYTVMVKKSSSAAVTGRATLTESFLVSSIQTPEERTALVPAESRLMEVS